MSYKSVKALVWMILAQVLMFISLWVLGVLWPEPLGKGVIAGIVVLWATAVIVKVERGRSKRKRRKEASH